MANEILVPEQEIREEDFAVLFPRNYAQYMAATIVDRAIPDARDGLKPVQRRILYCMYVNGYRSNKSTIKSAKIVGQVTGDFHPHGDVAIYLTMARMAQDFTLRYPLIDGQGNYGLHRQRSAGRLPLHRGPAHAPGRGAAGRRGPGDGAAGADLPPEPEDRSSRSTSPGTCRRW